MKVGDVVSMGKDVGTLTAVPAPAVKGMLVSVDFRGVGVRRVYASWLKVCECGQYDANRDCPVHGDGN